MLEKNWTASAELESSCHDMDKQAKTAGFPIAIALKLLDSNPEKNSLCHNADGFARPRPAVR